MDNLSNDYYYFNEPSSEKFAPEVLNAINPLELLMVNKRLSDISSDNASSRRSESRKENISENLISSSAISYFASQASASSQRYILLAQKASRKRNLSFIDWLSLYTERQRQNKANYYGKIFTKPMQTFRTGSKYVGEFNHLGFCGEGIYRFPHGVIYDGKFNREAQFHGPGKLIYPRGQTMTGTWKNGVLQPGVTFGFSDGTNLNVDYCMMSDRRFGVEYLTYFGSSGQEYLTQKQPTRDIPDGCYDIGEGFYNPRSKCVMNPLNPDEPLLTLDEFKCPLDDKKKEMITEVNANVDDSDLRNQRRSSFLMEDGEVQEIASIQRERWIKNNCRKAWDEATGYRPDLFETWTTGQGAHKEGVSTAPNRPLCDSAPKLQTSIAVSNVQKPSTFVSFIYKPKRPFLSRPKGRQSKAKYSKHSKVMGG